ncbi:MAG: thiamine-phosphate kinase [Steroidobacteraceae bacterium]
MALSEFALIERYFRGAGVHRADVVVGIGDDGAVLDVPAGAQLVAVVDSLVEGVHFPAGSPAASIGHRALAVNLSDLAAMGARPAWALLAITLRQADERWLEAFAAGFSALAAAHQVALVGGDTTAGPLSVTVQALGFVAPGRALLRSGGHADDELYVTGSPGDAACGLRLEQGECAVTAHAHAQAAGSELRRRFLYPSPRVEWGTALVGWASAAIDVSDGLLGDLGKLAAASGCGAAIDVERLPLSPSLIEVAGREGAEHFALTGGDDYELLFAVPPDRATHFAAHARTAGIACRAIGRLTLGGAVVARRGGSVIQVSHSGFDHFAGRGAAP